MEKTCLPTDILTYWQWWNNRTPFHLKVGRSQADEMKKEKYEKEITEHKEKIKVLKLSNTKKTATKNSFYRKQNNDSKNMDLTSTTSVAKTK